LGEFNFGPHFAIQVSFIVLISGKLIVGLDDYDKLFFMISHLISSFEKINLINRTGFGIFFPTLAHLRPISAQQVSNPFV